MQIDKGVLSKLWPEALLTDNKELKSKSIRHNLMLLSKNFVFIMLLKEDRFDQECRRDGAGHWEVGMKLPKRQGPKAPVFRVKSGGLLIG